MNRTVVGAEAADVRDQDIGLLHRDFTLQICAWKSQGKKGDIRQPIKRTSGACAGLAGV